MEKILTVDDLTVGQRVFDEMAGSNSKYGTVISMDYSNSEYPIVVQKDNGEVSNYSPACFIKI